jgi:hypothetical protein
MTSISNTSVPGQPTVPDALNELPPSTVLNDKHRPQLVTRIPDPYRRFSERHFDTAIRVLTCTAPAPLGHRASDRHGIDIAHANHLWVSGTECKRSRQKLPWSRQPGSTLPSPSGGIDTRMLRAPKRTEAVQDNSSATARMKSIDWLAGSARSTRLSKAIRYSVTRGSSATIILIRSLPLST